MVKITDSQTRPLLGLLLNRFLMVRVFEKCDIKYKKSPKMGKITRNWSKFGKMCQIRDSQTLPLLGLLVDWLVWFEPASHGLHHPPRPTATNVVISQEKEQK